MKITNDNVPNLRYWVDIVQPLMENDWSGSSDDVRRQFEKVVAEKGDTEEVDDLTLFIVFCIHALKCGKVYSDAFKKQLEATKAAINAGTESEELRAKLKDISQRYAAQVEIVADRELQIEELKKMINGQASTVNGSHEESVHRPQLHLVNDLQQFYIPFEEYPSLTQSVGTSDIANDEQLKRVQHTLQIKDVKEFSRTAFEFTISCGSRSTSDKDPYDGIIKIGGRKWERRDIEYAIKSAGITVRQFCAAYANLYWNFNLARSSPPENWRKKGFTEGTKFAAFDFFYAVGSNAAIPTEANGRVKLIRPPTNEENEANMAMRYADILEQSHKMAGHVTSSPLYNRGASYEPRQKAKLLEM
ncbi:coat protein [polyscias citrivirus 1]|uniref:Capsid protein n=1 Tax=polyscias citrivirus 1 TaxID=2945986 RepID=A0AAE9S269_9VIRU|nr:coat protein [polyscias citrivirus 1]